MNAGRRLLASAMLVGFALASTALAAAAADRPATATVPKTPRIYLVAPTRINLKTQPNVVLTGQYLAPTTRVVFGGRPATTLEAPDPNHLLVKVPSDLEDGTYILQASNGTATTTADEMITVQAGSMMDRQTLLILAGGLLLLLLCTRLARYRTF